MGSIEKLYTESQTEGDGVGLSVVWPSKIVGEFHKYQRHLNTR